jgi:hypothetical protein
MVVRLILGMLHHANQSTLKEIFSTRNDESPEAVIGYQAQAEKTEIVRVVDPKNAPKTDIRKKKSWQSILSELSVLSNKDKSFDSNGTIKKLIKSAISSALASGYLSTCAASSSSSSSSSSPLPTTVRTYSNSAVEHDATSLQPDQTGQPVVKEAVCRHSSSSRGWLHVNTSIVAELSVALSLYRQNSPSIALEMALGVLDMYGGYSLCLSKKYGGDLSFEDLENSELNYGSSTVNTSGDVPGNDSIDLLSRLNMEMKALCSSNDRKRKNLSESNSSSSSSSSSNVAPPPVMTAAAFRHLIILPTPAETQQAKASDSAFHFYLQNTKVTSISRDFGPPYGLFVGLVVSYLKPYYTIIYEDGDSEELSVDKVIQLRRCFAENVVLEDCRRNRNKFGKGPLAERQQIKLKLSLPPPPQSEDKKSSQQDRSKEEEGSSDKKKSRRSSRGDNEVELGREDDDDKGLVAITLADLPSCQDGIEFGEE